MQLQTLTEKHNELILSLEVKPEQISNIPWKKQVVEVLRHTYFTITFKKEGNIQRIDGYAQSGGSFFSHNEMDEVAEIYRSMNSLFYETLTNYTQNSFTSVKQEQIQEFVSFVYARLFAEALKTASNFPWYLWFWDGIEKHSSIIKMRTSFVPLSITRLFFLSIASLQHDTDISINKMRRNTMLKLTPGLLEKPE